jgi:hypothetical protein
LLFGNRQVPATPLTLDETDDDHSPSCPCKKASYTSRLSADPDNVPITHSLTFDLPETPPPETLPASCATTPTPWSYQTTTERYLTLRMLRI